MLSFCDESILTNPTAYGNPSSEERTSGTALSKPVCQTSQSSS